MSPHPCCSHFVATYGKTSRAILFLALALGFLLPWKVSFADVIYLKNGRKIVAQGVRENGKQVVYEVEGGEFALPRDLVDHIEKLSPEEAAPSPVPASRASELPLPPPPAEETASSATPVIKDGVLDEAYLLRLDDDFSRHNSPENAQRLKQGYQQAAVFLLRKGDAEGAIGKYRQALRLLPHDLAITLALGYLLVTQHHDSEAVELLQPAAARYPNSPDLPMLLGSAYYGLENLDQAIGEWNKALAIQDSPLVRKSIAKAERERKVAGAYSELRSPHFLLRFEGNEPQQFSHEVLNSLEGSFRELVLDLDYAPGEIITVLLYPNQAFGDITRSPVWVGALNDGKIRVPVSGLTTVNAELARVLKHELTHSFVRQITASRCPTWFNEGLAQLEEGATTATLGSQLARAFASRQIPSYASLEAPFMNLPPDQVTLAYGKSLAALEYLRDIFGMGEIRRLLRRMPSSPGLDSLLQQEIRSPYPTFEQDVAAYIEKRYGT